MLRFIPTNSGPAGGFFIGERFALDSGYRKIIHVESDAMPVSENAIEALDRETEGGQAAVPMMVSADRALRIPSYMHQYCCVPASCLRAVGLTYVPLNFGGEDSSLFERIRNFCGVRVVKGAWVSHPTFSRITKHWRIYGYVRGPLVSVMPWEGYFTYTWRLFRETVTSVAYASFSAQASRDSFRAILDSANLPGRLPFPPDTKEENTGITGVPFQGKLPPYDRFYLQLTGPAKNGEYVHLKWIEKGKLRVVEVSSFFPRMAARISMMLDSAGKTVVSNQISPLFPLFSKKFYILEHNQLIECTPGRIGRLWVAAAYIFAPAILLASALFSAYCFAFVRPAWRKEVFQYGLDENEKKHGRGPIS